MTTLHICPLSALHATLAGSQARNMVSLMGPGKSSKRPDQIDGSFLGLEFHDIAEPREGLIAANENHISQLIDLFQKWDQQSPLLLHCWMGISRSTAAAAIALATLNLQTPAFTIAKTLRARSPMATPNPLMISLADEQLGRNGSLIDSIANIGRGAEATEGDPFSISLEDCKVSA